MISRQAYEALRPNMRDLWSALDLIREEVQEHSVGALPGWESVEDPCPLKEAERIVKAIRRIAERK